MKKRTLLFMLFVVCISIFAQQIANTTTQNNNLPDKSQDLSFLLSGEKNGVLISIDLSHIDIDVKNSSTNLTEKSICLIPMMIINNTNSNLELNPLIDALFIVLKEQQIEVDLLPMNAPERFPSKILTHSKAIIMIGIKALDWAWIGGFIDGTKKRINQQLMELKEPSDISTEKAKMFQDKARAAIKGELDVDSVKLEIPLNVNLIIGKAPNE